MRSTTALCFAAAVCSGAIIASTSGLVFVVVVVGAVLFGRRGAFVGGALIVASLLSAHAWSNLDAALPPEIEGIAVVSSDPEKMAHSLRAEIDIDGRKYQAWFSEDAASAVSEAATGDRIRVEARVSELSGKATPSLRRKHIAGRAQVSTAAFHSEASGLYAVANGLREVIGSGASSMDLEDQALYRGLVLGDDSDQSDEQRQQFRDAGISHLLAVSGQNVAFLLLVMSPVIVLLGRRSRLLVVLAALVVFGTVTRWEPSVLRAVVMAAVVLVAHFRGHKLDAWRTLSIAIGVAVLLDPFLVGSIGFLLSATACVGMALLARPLSERIPGPRWLATGLGVTAAAQVGVAPVQLVVFGPMPIVALASNLAAGPLAAFVMMWGMTAGLLAGLAGGPWAVLLSWPPERAVEALAWVAEVSAARSALAWQLPSLLVAAGLLLVIPRRRRAPSPQDRMDRSVAVSR